MFAKRVEGRHSREFIHILGVVEKQRFLVDFDVNFLPVGTPGAGRPWVTRWCPRLILCRFLGVPGMPCGVLVVSLGGRGLPWSDLGRHVGAKSSEKRVKKKLLVHTACPSRLRVRKGSGPEA